MQETRSVFFSGICGSGMKPLALLSSGMNMKVFGTDKALQDSGNECRKVFQTFNIHAKGEPDPETLEKCDFYVYSSAIPEDHPERKIALQLEKENRIRVFHRMDFLNYLLRDHGVQIAVAGTHGKTSTTAMVGWILQNLSLNPTILVGGTPKFLPYAFRKGENIAVYETDESDGSFLKSRANYRLILNIDNDHLNYYGMYESLVDSFVKFAKHGKVVINFDDKELRQFPRYLQQRNITGFGKEKPEETVFQYFFSGTLDNNTLYVKIYEENELVFDSQEEGIHFSFPGVHFLYNGLGALAMTYTFLKDYPHLVREASGVNLEDFYLVRKLIHILNQFQGVKRRIEFLARYRGMDIYDDYGHHPTEIQAVLQSLRLRYQNKIAAVFQPHRYTRTKDLAKEFAKALEYADVVYLMPLYGAGEEPVLGVSSELIGRFIRKKVHYIKDYEFDNIFLQNYDCVIFMGAGDISKQIRTYLQNKLVIEIF